MIRNGDCCANRCCVSPISDFRLRLRTGTLAAEFREFLASRPQFRLVSPRHTSLVGQIQASLGEAARAKADFILYTESDKARFFENGLGDFLRRADLDDRTGAVLAARSEASFATFPVLQQFTERTINQLCARVHRHARRLFVRPIPPASCARATARGHPARRRVGMAPFRVCDRRPRGLQRSATLSEIIRARPTSGRRMTLSGCTGSASSSRTFRGCCWGWRTA